MASKRDVHINPDILAHKKVYQFDIMDNHQQRLDFEPVIKLIDEASQNGAVLVNCAVGMSRSPAFVIAYLMKTHQMSLHDAYVAVKSARPKINPNGYFMSQLREYEAILNEKPI